MIDEYLGDVFEDRVPDGAHGERWGSGEGQIERSRSSTPTGSRRRDPDRDPDVPPPLRDARAADQPVFGMAIQRIDGAEVTSPNTREAGLVPERVVGAGFVDLKLERLLLVPGTYDLSDPRELQARPFLRFSLPGGPLRRRGGNAVRGIRHSGPGRDVERGGSPTVSQPRQRILVATGDVLEPKMAGPAIRAWQIAIALSRSTMSSS